jgi:hypothetical protein
MPFLLSIHIYFIVYMDPLPGRILYKRIGEESPGALQDKLK